MKIGGAETQDPDKDPLLRTDLMKSKGMLWKTVVSSMQIDCCGCPLTKWIKDTIWPVPHVISFLCDCKF